MLQVKPTLKKLSFFLAIVDGGVFQGGAETGNPTVCGREPLANRRKHIGKVIRIPTPTKHFPLRIPLKCTWRIIPFSKWLITMASKSPLSRVVPFPNGHFMAYKSG